MMAKYIPRDIIEGEKKGFSGPDASWFKGESIDFVRNTLSNKNSPLYNYLDFKITQELVKDHTSGRQNRRLLIWSLLNVNEYLDGVLNRC